MTSYRCDAMRSVVITLLLGSGAVQCKAECDQLNLLRLHSEERFVEIIEKRSTRADNLDRVETRLTLPGTSRCAVELWRGADQPSYICEWHIAKGLDGRSRTIAAYTALQSWLMTCIPGSPNVRVRKNVPHGERWTIDDPPGEGSAITEREVQLSYQFEDHWWSISFAYTPYFGVTK